MRRQWYLDLTVKSQMEVVEPSQFYLRPSLEEGKFPQQRSVQVPEEVAASIAAQDAAGRLVFEMNKVMIPTATTVVEPAPTVEVKPEPATAAAVGETPSAYAQRP